MPNKTQNDQLNQWMPEDDFLRTDFNEDNGKIDSALKALDNKVETKANQTDLTSLTSTVNTKASQADLNSLTSTVNTKASQTDLNNLSTTVSKKANQSDLTSLTSTVNTKAAKTSVDALTAAMPKIVTGSYVGTGTYGENNPNRLDFAATLGRLPKLIYVVASIGAYSMLLTPGLTTQNSSNSYANTIQWTNTGVSWYSTSNKNGQMNNETLTYLYIAIG